MSVKIMLFGFAALGVSGAALTSGGGFGGGHDAERAVARPPAEVYAAISSMSPEGVQHRDPESGPPMSFEVTKEPGKAVHWVLKIEGKVAGSVDLAVAPDKEGSASRLSADIDFDRTALRKVMPGGEEVLAMPDAVFNVAALGLLGELAQKIEAGIPLDSFSPDDLAAWEGPRQSGDGEATGQTLQGADVSPKPIRPDISIEPRPIQPTASTDPMLDPNESASNYLKGGQ
jgi:hypothetical protein